MTQEDSTDYKCYFYLPTKMVCAAFQDEGNNFGFLKSLCNIETTFKGGGTFLIASVNFSPTEK